MIAVDIALVVLALAFLAGLVRVAIGPTLADRAVATDVCLFTVASAFALFSVKLDTVAFIDASLLANLLGFVATVSLARLIGRER